MKVEEFEEMIIIYCHIELVPIQIKSICQCTHAETMDFLRTADLSLLNAFESKFSDIEHKFVNVCCLV